MLELPTVTLCCVDTKNHALAVRSIARSRRNIRFARTILFTNTVPQSVNVPQDVEVCPIDTLQSREAYSQFIIKKLVEHINTDHVLVTQWDGYATNPEVWDPAFLDCDYIGAPWTDALNDRNVGNGGFSLRSRRLLEALQDPRIEVRLNEDQEIGDRFRDLLEREHRIRFGTSALARTFSFEMDHSHIDTVGPTFGFHGLFNFFQVESQPEIVSLAPQLSDGIARSEFCFFLLSNCANYKQWEAAIALADRMLEADPDNEKVAELLVAAKAHRDYERTQELPSTRRPFGFLRRWSARK
jgi:hypothetical protein